MVCYECSAVQNERQTPHASWRVLCLVQELVRDPAHLQVALCTWDFRGTDWEKAWKIWSIHCWAKPVHLLAHTDGGLGLCPFHICFEHALGFEGSSGGWFVGLRRSLRWTWIHLSTCPVVNCSSHLGPAGQKGLVWCGLTGTRSVSAVPWCAGPAGAGKWPQKVSTSATSLPAWAKWCGLWPATC